MTSFTNSFFVSFVASFVVLLLVIAGMAIGVIKGRAAIKGSCGGLAIDGRCKYCGSDGTECLDTDKS